MYLDNIVKFARGGLTERPALKEYVIMWLLPLCVALIAMFYSESIREYYDKYYCYYRLFFLAIIVVYVIVSLRIMYCMSLRDYLKLYCVIFFALIFTVSAFSFALIIAENKFRWLFLLIYLPMFIASLLVAWWTCAFFKSSKEYSYVPMSRFSIRSVRRMIRASGSILGVHTFGRLLGSKTLGLLILLSIGFCLLGVMLTICILRLYFARKYKISWKTVDGIENTLH